jgi:acetoin utilization deacetylase AcuC-like enzyme
MKLFFAPDQLKHRPQQYFRFGKVGQPLENPERMETLADALARLGLDRRAPADQGLDPILAVHDPAYVDFLQRIWGLWRALAHLG